MDLPADGVRVVGDEPRPVRATPCTVAAAAGVPAASLYQFFGDKDGLLATLAIHAFDSYLAEKHTVVRTDDPVEDMRRGWDAHVDFGLRHPAFYLLMYGTDRPGRRPPAAGEAHDLLLKFLDRVAAAGRLRVPPELAARLCVAAVTGVTLALIGTPAEDRDPENSVRMRHTLIDSLTTDPPPPVQPGLPGARAGRHPRRHRRCHPPAAPDRNGPAARLAAPARPLTRAVSPTAWRGCG